ncbi:glutamine amidotransferase [Micromonospora pattaloongensis]|uniref:Gamma-glutamyl-hercynylcysteine sulfoxide hydrolase n=1 Tax=Micromonospora pattaloongensis TaxID=405436 RepID=A0A1H3NSH2_9ACTN|nr:ergothioneine biosynthesis protein EgtC [Micromonospora pattaloongensis]SDY91640.1 glutamine amidotransferase [Micromonospora pattaloongensis]
MCRHLAYLGAPVRLAELLFDPPHALVRQSWAPREMRGGGTVNADGFGVGWYPGAGQDPVRYRRDRPMWSDAGLAQLAAVTTATGMLAAVRSATVGMPLVETAVAPFAAGRWLFSHNGVIAGWPDSVLKLAERLPVRDLLTVDAPTDSALIWAMIRDRLRAGATAPAALAETAVRVAAAAPGSRLNLLLTDGEIAAATTVGHSLWARRDDAAVLLSSEPLDGEPAWTPLPDGHLIVATGAALDVIALPDGGQPQ